MEKAIRYWDNISDDARKHIFLMLLFGTVDDANFINEQIAEFDYMYGRVIDIGRKTND